LSRVGWVGVGSAGQYKEVFSNRGDRTDKWISVVVTLTNLSNETIAVSMARNKGTIFDIGQIPPLNADLGEITVPVVRLGETAANGRIRLAFADFRALNLPLLAGDEVAFEIVINDEEVVYASSDKAGLAVNVDFTG
jgi:hypothetical protein